MCVIDMSTENCIIQFARKIYTTIIVMLLTDNRITIDCFVFMLWPGLTFMCMLHSEPKTCILLSYWMSMRELIIIILL